MRTTDLTKGLMNAENELSWDDSSSPVALRAYHELADRPVVELDSLAQLEANLALLESLQGRLSFVLREVSGLLKV